MSETIPSADALRAYLRARGWTQHLGPESVWSRDGRYVEVPGDGDPDAIREVLAVVARAEGLNPADVTASVRSLAEAAESAAAGSASDDTGRPLPTRDESAQDCAGGTWRERAVAAEARLAEIRERAETWAALAPADDWGLTPTDTVAADCGRAILAITGTGEEASGG